MITRTLFPEWLSERKTILTVECIASDRIVVHYTQEGASDDSVEGEMRIIQFEKQKDSWWTNKQIQVGCKCWEGRGHQNYSGEPCS